MKLLIAFAMVLVAASAQEYYSPTAYLLDSPAENAQYEEVHHLTPEDYEEITHPRFRRGVSMDPKTGDVTAEHKLPGGRVFGTVGSNDNGNFGKAGYERNYHFDGRGQLDAQMYGQRNLSPYGDSSSLGGALKWKDDHATASFDASRQIHGGTSWTAAGGGRWPVGKNGDIGVEGTYSHFPGGVRDYGGRGSFNYRW